MLQVDNALSLIKLGALDGINGNGIDNTPLHDLIYLSEFPYISLQKQSFNPSSECHSTSIRHTFSDDNQLNAKSTFNGLNMNKMRSIGDDQDYVDGEVQNSNLNAPKDEIDCTNRHENRNESLDTNKYPLNLDELSSHDNKVGKNKCQTSDANEMEAHEPDMENDHEEIESKFGKKFN